MRDLATKADTRIIVAGFREEMAKLRAEIKADMEAQTATLSRLLITAMVALTAMCAIIAKWL